MRYLRAMGGKLVFQGGAGGGRSIVRAALVGSSAVFMVAVMVVLFVLRGAGHPATAVLVMLVSVPVYAVALWLAWSRLVGASRLTVDLTGGTLSAGGRKLRTERVREVLLTGQAGGWTVSVETADGVRVGLAALRERKDAEGLAGELASVLSLPGPPEGTASGSRPLY